ncbi:MAG: hypothetical protein CO099_11920 [Bdellovibrio sp. CG_4_9_14_3_um_filter_39_7]|nr:MAG: hypothetical protein CO099_11920 [Bdellovibrio sp. CG_4_9_14_3_um_filter_39_7]
MKLTALPVILYHFSTANAQDCSKTGVPCIPEPKGMLEDNEKAKAGVSTINWIVGAIVIAVIIGLGIKAAGQLEDNKYKEAVGPLLGIIVVATVSGIVIWAQKG